MLKRRDFITHFGAACASSLGAAWTAPLGASLSASWAMFCAVFRPSVARAQDADTQIAAGQTADEIGQVATLHGSATVTRGRPAATVALRIKDPIFKNDMLATAADSTLGITFDDQTTFSLSANTRIVIDEFVYQEGGGGNAATFNVVVGTAAFVASLVAKTGDMTITTPSTTLGIRGTTGVVDVPPGGAAGAGESRIKLYADSDGHVGRIEVFNRQGGRLGILTQGASAFAVARGPGGAFRAVPFQIPPAEAARDRGVLQRLFVSHTIGRRMTIQRLRARGPNRLRPNNGQPGRRQQPFNRDQRPGGPQHPGGTQHPGTQHPGTQHPGTQQPGGQLHPGFRQPGGPQQPGGAQRPGSLRSGGNPPRPRAPRGGAGGGRNKRR